MIWVGRIHFLVEIRVDERGRAEGARQILEDLRIYFLSLIAEEMAGLSLI